MTRREKIQLGVIGILAIMLAVVFATSAGSLFSGKNVSIEQQTLKGFPQKPDNFQTPSEQDQKQSKNVEYAVINADPQKQSNQLTVLFKKVENSVVQITTKVSTINPNIIINGSPLESQSSRLGSGFVYDTSGHIITNNHVIQDAKEVDVRFIDGNIYSAKVVGADPFNDVAVLEITDDFTEESIIPLPLANSADLEVGQQIVAIGNPFGLSNTMTTGIVSQIGRLLPNRDAGYSIPNVIQTDAAINPGNSGGPMLNLDGQVIGINTAIQSATGEFSGIGFAVPSNTIKRLIPSLIEKGSYEHPWLGVSGISVTPEIAKQIGLAKNYKGVFVTTIVDDSPAQKAGLKEAVYNANRALKGGDVIISLDGHQVRDIDDLIIYLADNKVVGDKISLEINRGGEIIDLVATLSERPSN